MMNYSIQNILVPIDLSESSLNALDAAVALSKKHNACVYLLSVNETFTNLADKQKKESHLPQPHVDVLHALASAAKDKNATDPIVLEKEGNVVEVIYQTCLEYPIDLIVIGTHGASGYREGFIGSNAYNTVKYANCPVLTVPPKRKIVSFERILFPIRPAFGALTPFSVVSKFINKKAAIDVLGLSYHQQEVDVNIIEKIVDEIDQALKNANASTQSFWGPSTDIVESVIEHVQVRPPDIVILTSIIDVITKSGFVGPYTQKLLHSLRVPILNIKGVNVPHQRSVRQMAN